MSYYGGGGGWAPPGFYLPNQGVGPPPTQQPPPTAYFPTEPAAYTQGRGPYDFVQSGYVSSAPSHPHGHPGTRPAPELTTPQTALYTSVPPPQQQALSGDARNSPLVPERTRTSLERSRDSRTPPRRHSPTPEDRYERKAAVNRRRDPSPEDVRYRRRRSPSGSPDRHYDGDPHPRGRSPETFEQNFKRGRKGETQLSREIPLNSKSGHPGVDVGALLHRDSSPEELRYRQRRAPRGSPDAPYSGEPRPRGRSPETFEENYLRSRKDGSQLSREIPQKSKPDHSGVDLDALLKDERLRNVLFAKISKATAKLEQSLQKDTDSKDNIAFLTGSLNEAKSHLFPSASTSGGSQQKPRSILKRKTDTDESGDASAALGSLNTLEKTLQMLRGKTDTGESSSVSSREQSKSKVESKVRGALGQLASYDDDNEEEAYLYGSKESSPVEKKKASSSTHPFWSVDVVAAKREEESKVPDTFEMKDKMFEKWRQSIHKSPERQFTLSKDLDRDQSYEKESRSAASRSRPLSGKTDENQEELDSTVQNILQSIGFDFDLSQRMQQLARKKKIQEEEKSTGISNLSASFLGKSSILTEELKASLLQSGNDLSKIDSLLQEARAGVHLDRSMKRRERSPSPITRRAKSPEVDRAVMIKDRLKAKMSLSDWPDQMDELRRHSKPYISGEYEASSSIDSHSLEDRRARSALRASENLYDVKDEYFYPEKDQGEVPPGVPLLTSFSSRPTSEDLSSGLLKSMRVENFRVMSRPVYDDDNEEFMETRRIILPAKLERKVLSRSPSARGSRSPSLRGSRKRSGSPMSLSALKERKVISRSGSLMESQQKSLVYERISPMGRHSVSPMRSPDNRAAARRRESISPPARRRLSGGRRSPSPKGSRSKYRQRERSRSPDHRRSRSPRRYRSRSPIRRRSRSRSPRRRRSRSRSNSRPRYRKSPLRFTSPLRRRPTSRRSPEKKNSHKTDPKISVDKRGMGVSNKDTNAKAKTSGQPQTPTQVDLSKMTDDERKSHLKKMLGVKEAAPVVPETAKVEESENVKAILESFEKLASSFNRDKKAEIIAKLKPLAAGDRTKVLDNVKSRFSKIMLLKIEVVKLKKQQNELMRKNQRRGIGPEDPELSVNERKQARVEKEIERLSAADLDVEVGEFSVEEVDVSSEVKSSQTPQDVKSSTTPQDKKGSKRKASNNLPQVPLSKPGNKKNVQQKPQLKKDPESVSQTESSGKKKTAASAMKDEKKKAHTSSESGKNSWTSVDVKDELPVIEGDTPKNEGRTKRGNASDASLKSTTKKKIYYEYIDSGNHFCRHCHATCNTLGQFFEHTHGRKHSRAISKLPKPWDEPKLTKGKNLKVGQAQSRRIKGSEFIIPVTGFYCSLCKVFCGDFGVTENHLKNDSHYDKYLDYIRDNTTYEKDLLLERTRSIGPSALKKKSPSGPVKEEKGREKKAHLRVKTEEEEDPGAYDQIGAVDMELDDDLDVQSKVPKMVPKSLPFIPPPPPEPAVINTMKTRKEDKDQSLDQFLTIDPPKTREGEKIPVICSQPAIDLSSIPVPASLPTAIRKVERVHTVKSLQEVQDEEKKVIEEEKRMMGIDVDAEEEKPLAVIKRPPMLQNLSTVSSETNEAVAAAKSEQKKTSVDSLFAKLNKNAAQKRKPKVLSALGPETTEMEMRIQQEIAEKLNKEKEKLLRKKQKEEERERRREEEQRPQKKKIYSSSESSSEESEEDQEEVSVNEKEIPQIPLPDGSSEIPPTEQKPVLKAEAESTVEEPSGSFVTDTPAIDTSKNQVKIMSENLLKSAEVEEKNSSHEGTNVEVSEVTAGVDADNVSLETVRKGKTPVKKRNATGSVLVTESDLSRVFTSSLETVSQEARKKLNKKVVKKRIRHPKTHQDVEGKEIDMEDYVILSEVTEEDEGGMQEVKDEDEMLAELLSDASSKQIENKDASLQVMEVKDGSLTEMIQDQELEIESCNKPEEENWKSDAAPADTLSVGLLEVMEVKEDGGLTKKTPNQELEINSCIKPEEENWKNDATSVDMISVDNGHSVSEEKKGKKPVEEPSPQPSDNGHSEKHNEAQELFSASTVDDKVFKEENLKNDAAPGEKVSADDGPSKSDSEEKTILEPSAHPHDDGQSGKHHDEAQDLFSASIGDQEVFEEGNSNYDVTPGEQLSGDDAHSKSVVEEKSVEEPYVPPSDSRQSEQHADEEKIVEEPSVPPSDSRQSEQHADEEKIVEEPSVQPYDIGQSGKHHDEAQDLFSASIGNQEVPEEGNLYYDATPGEQLSGDDMHSKSVGEKKKEEKSVEEPSAEPTDSGQSENHTEVAVDLSASIIDHKVLCEPEKSGNENCQENQELPVPVLSQEVPITPEGQPSELTLTAPTLVQEISPTLVKDTENVTEEKPPVLTVPAPAHGAGRGRGKKSGGRGRGRGKRGAKKGRADDSSLTDESPGNADENCLELQPPSVDDTLALTLKEEADKKTEPSPSKRGRRGKAPSTPRRVTRSRINQIQNEEDNNENMNEPVKAAVEEEKQPDKSTTICQTDSLTDGLEAVDEKIDTDHFSSEVGIRCSETTSFNPGVSMEDIQIIPTLTEQPNPLCDALPLLDPKDGSDSDATITEDQEIVESQITFDDSETQSAQTAPQVSSMAGMESMKSLEEFDDACLAPQGDGGQEIPVSENSSLLDPTHQDGCDTKNTSVDTVMQQDMSSLSPHLHANQPRDPPMSGIVSEIEAPDDIMDVDGDGADDTYIARPEADIPESEGLPTSGLGLDLEDVTDSISFPLDDDNIKTDSSEPM